MLPLLIVPLVVSKVDTNYMQATLGSPNLLTPQSISGSRLRFWLPYPFLALPSILTPPPHFGLLNPFIPILLHSWLTQPCLAPQSRSQPPSLCSRIEMGISLTNLPPRHLIGSWLTYDDGFIIRGLSFSVLMIENGPSQIISSKRRHTVVILFGNVYL